MCGRVSQVGLIWARCPPPAWRKGLVDTTKMERGRWEESNSRLQRFLTCY